MKLIKGIPASPGTAVGPARILERVSLDVPETARPAEDADMALAQFKRALDKSVSELNAILESAKKKLSKEDAEIFNAHLMMLEDPELIDVVNDLIGNSRLTADSAVALAIRSLAARFDEMDDEYFRARAADVRDIGRRILKNLKREDTSEAAAMPGIIVTVELTPSDTVNLDVSVTAGIATELGGATSHASILARSLGIPCVVGARGLFSQVTEGAEIAVDGYKGEIYIQPDMATKQKMRSLSADAGKKKQVALSRRNEPALTRRGRRVDVLANAKSPEEIAAGVDAGAEGVGLFRTEFLFLERRTMPGEDEQESVYRAAAVAAAGRPVAIRLLDIGGDKPAPYLQIPDEMNPFLGLRAVRLLLERRDVLKTQLRAIYRAADAGDVSIMVPMITDVTELDAVRAAASECRAELERNGLKIPNVQIGIMIETPAAALCAGILAQKSDFFSIGTNDLTQYCMAVDRGNSTVANLYRVTHPSVETLVAETVKEAHRAGIKVCVCGEAAGDSAAVPMFLRLGVDSLSVVPAIVPDVKEYVREFGLE